MNSNLSFIAQDFTGPSESRCVAQPISVTAARRSPPPWSIEEANAACFIVKDHNGHAPAYVYLQNEPGRRAAAKPQTKEAPGASTSPNCWSCCGARRSLCSVPPQL